MKSRLNEIVREINAKIFSSSKLLEILCALSKSPRIAFLLYFWGLLMTSDGVS